ncbi:27893_t:CDS:2 [Gigaspora margarita]|uniref:27893_t:CDS:1 n=1 Tax=Gigaspora margarita TaxID=4874 RepID=A0ABN7V5K5_GIGMA|nr:27893_t:CDS:2 [Gigaspora margarita]
MNRFVAQSYMFDQGPSMPKNKSQQYSFNGFTSSSQDYIPKELKELIDIKPSEDKEPI